MFSLYLSQITSPTRTLRRLGAGLLLFLLAGAAHAQTGTLTGVVTDGTTAEPLIGATVAVQGTTRGAATDLDGQYTVALSPGTYTIRVSFTGFIPQTQSVTIRAGQTATQNVTLEEDLTGLEEVVVTGALSSRSVAESEVSVSRINAAELTEIVPYTDFTQLVNGKAAGVSVQPSSGNVGGGVRFNIRSQGGLNGDGQPLIFIDGIRINRDQLGGFGAGGQQVGALSDLNPNDIANVEILKGPAAAALYGTNASNGVVLITTKRGKVAGSGAVPFSLSYQGVAGSNRRQTAYTDVTGGESVQAANNIFQTGAIQQHTISASGGSESVRYFTQFDLRDEDGIVFGNFQNRRAVRGNFEAFPFRNLTLGVNTSYTFNKVGSPQNDNNIIGYLGNVLLFPTAYGFTDSSAVRAVKTEFNTNRFLGGFNALYTPIKGLALSGNVGLDIANGRQDQSFPSNFSYSGVTNGERDVFFRDNGQVSFQVDGRYSYTPVEDLDLQTSLGVQGFDTKTTTAFTTAQDFATALITSINAGADLQSTGESLFNERQFGFLGEQSFDYKSTLIGAAGLRVDLASSLGNSQNILYPFVRGAVRLDQLDAVPSAFSILKLRAAYGESGQLPGRLDGIPLLYGAVVGGDGSGAVPTRIGNPNIKPERIRETELGLDAELFGRVSAEATYYFQKASDSIFGVRLPPSSGLVASTRPTNVGSIKGSGFELGLNATPYRTRGFGVDLGVIFNYQTNTVESIGFGSDGVTPLPTLFDGFSVNAIKPGLPRAAFFSTPVNGALFNPTTGAYAGVDAGITPDNIAQYQSRIDDGTCIDEDGTDGDRCYFGQPYAKYNGSFTLNVTAFRDLTFYALADWATGLSVFNNTAAFQASFGNSTLRNMQRDQLGFGTVDDIPNLTPGTAEYDAVANAYARTNANYDANYIEKADYIKLREITVRYNIGRFIGQQPGFGIVRTASLALSARNLFTSSPYSGVDPEVNFDGGRGLSRGQDFLTLQNPRQLFVTLQLGI